MEYKFNCEEKEFILDTEKCSAFFNDEEKEVKGFSIEEAIRLVSEAENVQFIKEYYQEACPDCMAGVKEKQKFFGFYEYHFYIFTKNGEYIISDIDKNYPGNSFNKLSRAKKVDDSYIVSIIVCSECGEYIIQVENCEI
ncbi:DUF3785 family protein [Peptacetobacter sp.]|uniref:DUF3785 family protein n=1 Tax=Peptacetobacter sp. TaxID=2991975 RepID=UPI002610BDE7|nr:DUF3785 family protein [Peptacetobacter sp.]